MKQLTMAWNALINLMGRHRARARIHGDVRFECERLDGGGWVAECEPLNLTMVADSFSDLIEDMVPTLDALFNDLRKTGDLEAVLDHAGLRAEPSAIESAVSFDLPFSTHVRRHEDPARALAV